MSFPKFSVITPVHIHSQNRLYQLYRAIDSVKNQTYRIAGEQEELFEHIVVDEGSITPFEKLEFIQQDFPQFKYKKIEEHLERLNAYHEAFEMITKQIGVSTKLTLKDKQLLAPLLEAKSKEING